MDLSSYTETTYSNLIQKLRDYCKCIPSTLTDKEIWNGGLFKVMILVSSFLRWGDGTCNDMLVRNRIYKSKVDFGCCLNGFDLLHNNVQNIQEFSVYKVSSCEETKYTVVNPHYSQLTNKLRLCNDTELTDADNNLYRFCELYNCCSNNCKCSPEWYIEVKYTAGLQDIPDCLVPIICELYSYMQLINNGCTDACKSNQNVAYNGLLVEQTVGDRTWRWSVPNNIVEDSFAEFVSKGLFVSLSSYANKRSNVFVIDVLK